MISSNESSLVYIIRAKIDFVGITVFEQMSKEKLNNLLKTSGYPIGAQRRAVEVDGQLE